RLRRRYHGTPALSETRLWNNRGRYSACCGREGRSVAADFGGAASRASPRRRGRSRRGHAGRCRSSQARTGTLGPSLAPALAPASLGLASPSLGLAPPLAPSPLVRRPAATRLAFRLRSFVGVRSK